MNGDKHTGVTLQTLSTLGFDRGKIFDQSYAIRIPDDESLKGLWDRLSQIAAKMLISSLRDRTFINPQPINTFTSESYAGQIDKKVLNFDWRDLTADRLERLARIGYPITGAIGRHSGKRFGVQLSGISPGAKRWPGVEPGTYKYVGPPGKMTVCCGDHETVLVDKVKVSGKNWISGQSFVSSSTDRFWGGKFVPQRREFEDHDQEEFEY
jgi:methionyl-tRNA formyltransferase